MFCHTRTPLEDKRLLPVKRIQCGLCYPATFQHSRRMTMQQLRPDELNSAFEFYREESGSEDSVFVAIKFVIWAGFFWPTTIFAILTESDKAVWQTDKCVNRIRLLSGSGNYKKTIFKMINHKFTSWFGRLRFKFLLYTFWAVLILATFFYALGWMFFAGIPNLIGNWFKPV